MTDRVSEVREGARRQHRMLGLYAALFCWTNGYDGCRVERGPMERLLGLKRFKGTRVDWIQEDLQSFFSVVEPRWDLELAGKPWSVLYLSRQDLDEDALDELPDLRLWRAVESPPEGSADLGSVFGGAIPDERALTAVLALIAGGQLTPPEVPGMLVEG